MKNSIDIITAIAIASFLIFLAFQLGRAYVLHNIDIYDTGELYEVHVGEHVYQYEK